MKTVINAWVEKERGYIQLNRPDKRNPLSSNVITELVQALEDFEGNPKVKTIIIYGNGPGFSAGGDISEMGDHKTLTDSMSWMRQSSKLTKTIKDLNKYVISVVHGFAAGAGFSLALASDFIIAEKNAKFVCSFINVGLVPDLGLTKLLSERLPLPLAKELVASGRTITGQELFDKGVVNRVGTEENLLNIAEEFSQFIIDGPPLSHLYGKKILNNSTELNFESMIMQENIIQSFLNWSEDHKEGINAFLEKRKPQFKGK